MFAYRIDRAKRTNSVPSGKGAELYGGRWNVPGTPVVYCASSRSLAILEVLVHMEWQRHLPQDRIMVTLDVPDDRIHFIKKSSLSARWRDFPYNRDSQQVFADFLQSKAYRTKLAIAIPSAIVDEELNICIDPTSAFMSEVKIIDVKAWQLDERFR